MLSRRLGLIVALVAAAVLVVALNVIAGRWLGAARLDLTQQHLYTLSDGTLKTLSEIDEPITLRFYYSPQLGDTVPSYGVYAARVREMLAEYVAAAKGKVKLEVLDPEPFSTTEDRAVALGLQGAALDQGGDQVYFGLAASNSTDDQALIDFFHPERERFLEYDITKLIHGLAFPKKTVVGLVTSLPLEGDMMAMMQGRQPEPYMVLEELRQLDTVKTLSSDFDRVPDDVDVLMIAHPQNLPDKTLYAIDQFVLKGGKALVFVDPYSETQAAHPNRMQPGGPSASDLEKLFSAWGVAMEKDKVAGDLDSAVEVNIGSRTLNYIGWLSLRGGSINANDPITGDLKVVNVESAGILKPREGAKTQFEPLLTTSAEAEEIPAEQVQGMPDVAGLLRGFKSGNEKLTVAARITGPADTAFPDGPPAEKAEKDPKPPQSPAGSTPQLTTAAKPIDVVVVADTDILDDRSWVEVQNFLGRRVVIGQNANNGDFVANAVDVLAGGVDLLGLRTRGTAARPFEVVSRMQKAAEQRFQAHANELEQQLKDTQEKMRKLQGKEPEPATVAAASEQETKTLDDFRKQVLHIRQQLREVRLDQRRDLDGLKERLEFLNIAAVPLLVGFAAAGVGILRQQRRRRRSREK